MYLNFWPVSLDRFGAVNAQNSGVYSWPFPASQLAENRARIQQVGVSAARAYIASQTVAPDMTAEFLNSTGSGSPTVGELGAVGGPGGPADFSGAPSIIPLNPSQWTAPRPYMACPGAPAPGIPWNDALYSTGGGGAGARKGWLLLLLGVAAAAGLSAGRKKGGK